MKKWIRWQGLFVFIGLSLFLTIFWLIFMDGIVKRIIESYGTRAVGAKVEVADADLKLFPLGLVLKGLAVTNPDKPMENIVEISRAALLLEPLQLLRRKVIVEEMTLAGIRLNTARKTSGAVVIRKEKDPVNERKNLFGSFCGTVRLPDIATLDIRKILADEKLESLELIQNLQSRFQAENDNWQKKLDGLPGKEKFDSYRNRINQLKSKSSGLGGLLGTAGDLASLQKDLQTDLDRLKSAQKEFDQLKVGLNSQWQQAAAAPLKDFERLKQKYAFSPQGLDNMGKLVLGQKICGGLEQAVQWYERLNFVLRHLEAKGAQDKKEKPVRPQRRAGTYVRFKECAPLPDFLIRRAKTSLLIEAGDFSGKIENITLDQDILGQPLTFTFSGEKLKQVQMLKLDGSFNRVIPERPKDGVSLQLKDYNLHNTALTSSGDLPVTVKEGLADVDLQAKLEKNGLDGTLAVRIKSAVFDIGKGDGRGPVLNAIGSVLGDLSGFTAKVDVSGSANDYQVRLTTDLDQALKSAAGKIIQQQAEKFEKELKQGVLDKTGGALNELKTDQNILNQVGAQLTDRLNLGNGLLGSIKRPL